ncbi:OLC1v1009178C1 [Oldenlandia corymbosa var. corymbosa]|uniref:OLC1v1009178C1 n=1 Tax=Oldenlandia corymbosa var. corymbosa TaxID=529605 RepID=A0AAV1DPU2_OLDCO|nr:OLC1v1009178C1 [Oldenlandia corymbosa var. corymbosa]
MAELYPKMLREQAMFMQVHRPDIGAGTSGGRTVEDNEDGDEDGDEDKDEDKDEDANEDEDVGGVESSDDEYVPSDEDSDDDTDFESSSSVPYVFDDISGWDKTLEEVENDGIKMWDGNPLTLGLDIHFANKPEAQAAVGEWNLVHGRTFRVKTSSKRTWREFRYRRPPILGKWWYGPIPTTCLGANKRNESRNVTSSMIARLVAQNVRKHPDFAVAQIQIEVMKRYQVECSYKKAWHGRRKALEAQYGTWESNFQQLPSFLNALFMSNPDTCVQFKFKENSGSSQRFVCRYVFGHLGHLYAYFMLVGQVITIDATHLRGSYKGKLIVACVKCANGTIVPIAFALVDEETIHTGNGFETVLPPTPMKLYEEARKKSLRQKVNRFSKRNQKYEVVTIAPDNQPWKADEKQVVLYANRECTCGRWQTFRFPCSHALRVARELGDDPFPLFDPCYTTHQWYQQFSGEFNPIMEPWPKATWQIRPDDTKLVHHAGRGRKRVNRKKGVMDYTSKSGQRRLQTCSLCKLQGHNARACPYARVCARCGSLDHDAVECPFSHPPADRTGIDKLYDPYGIHGVPNINSDDDDDEA